MYKKPLFLFTIFFLLPQTFYAQNQWSPKEAKAEQKQFYNNAKQYEKEGDIRQQLLAYYKAMELIPYTDDAYEFNTELLREMGFLFRRIGVHDKSISYFKQFVTYYHKHRNRFDQKAKLFFDQQVAVNYNMIADNYASMGKLDSAAYWLKKTIAYTRPKKHIGHISALNNYGLYFHHRLGKIDSALKYYRKAEQLAVEKFKNEHLYGSIIDNIADVYVLQGKFAIAAELYQQNFEFYPTVFYNEDSTIDYLRWVAAGAQWSEMLIRLDRSQKAKTIIDSLVEVLEISDFYRPHLAESKMLYHNVMASYHQKQKDYEAALKSTLRSYTIKDSLQQAVSNRQKRWQTTLSDILINRVQADLEHEKEQRAALIKRQQLQISIGVLIFVLVITVFLFMYRQRKQHLVLTENRRLLTEQKAKNILLQNNQLELEIQAKKRELADVALNLSQNLEWGKELYEFLSKVKQSRGRQRRQMMVKLEQEIKNKITIDKQTEAFYARLDVLNETFYKKLRHRYSGLTKNDVRLCSLIRLKIENADIASLQNISQASLNTARYRLRKKLKLKKEENLDGFIQKL